MSDTTKVDATSTATTDTTNQDSDLDQIQGLGDAGKQTIRKEREARRIAEEKATVAANRLTELEKAEAKRIRDEETAKEAKAVEDGQFKDLAEKRGNDLQTVTTERDTFKSQIDAYKTAISPVIDERLKAVQEADEETAKVFPKDADPLAQLDWLNSPLVRRVVDLSKQSTTNAKYLNHVNTPKPNTTHQPNETEQQRLKQSGKYSI